MKHNISSKCLISLVFLTGLIWPTVGFSQAEKNEVYLFSCPISTSNRFEQVVLKSVKVEEQNGIYEYFILDVEAGNQTGSINGEGEHLKYIQTVMSSQNATDDQFYRTHGDNFQLDVYFRGHNRDSKIQINMDKTHTGKYILDVNGNGPLFYDVRNEYEDVLRNSEFYSTNWRVECFVHPRVGQFLD